MHLPLTVILKRTVEGLFLHLFANSASDQVGPLHEGTLNVGDEKVFDAILSIEDVPMNHAPSSRLKKRSRREELKIAADIGGRAQPNSGALPGAKGDVRKRGEHRIESKITGSRQYILTRKLLDKIRGECAMGEKPAFIITFIHKQTLREEDRWVCIPYEDWHEAHVNR